MFSSFRPTVVLVRYPVRVPGVTKRGVRTADSWILVALKNPSSRSGSSAPRDVQSKAWSQASSFFPPSSLHIFFLVSFRVHLHLLPRLRHIPGLGVLGLATGLSTCSASSLSLSGHGICDLFDETQCLRVSAYDHNPSAEGGGG